ncbi:hypothetical protein FIBSPDRAFT_715186, partial [Athelia psychrophila]
IGRLPAWPCRACGSANHWDRECPMWDRFQSKVKSAKWVEAGDPEEDGQLYTQVYQTFLAQIEDSTCVLSEEREDADQPLAEKEAALNQASSVVSEGNTPTILRKSSVEDVEDEDQLAQQRKPKARGASALEDADDEPVEAEAFANYSGIPSHSTTTGTPSHQTEALDPPLADTDPIRIPKRKKAAPGKAAVGTSVLSVRGRVNRLQEREIDLWLDSGADVSLISQDFLESLKVKPAIRQGMKMRLWQLTSKNETLAGYVNVPLFIQAEDGTMLETEVEAYVVPGMSVDILLGEDYQLCHEIAIRRSVETGTRIEFGGLPYCVKASRRHRKNVKFGNEKTIIRAAADLLIGPNSVASLKVDGYFQEDTEKDWLVEKSLLANDDDSFFAVPNVLFSSSNPIVPVMNPTDKPRYIRKGEAIGTIVNPGEFLDTPKSEQHWENMSKSAMSIAALIS